MTIYCPRCGQAGCDETVTSFVSVWSSCARCHLVWRSSLLEKVVGLAARGVGLSKSEKIAARYNALQTAEQLQHPSGSLKPVSVDRVAEWLASQERPTGAPRLAVTAHSSADAEKIEEMFDMLDPVKKSGMSPAPAAEREPARDKGDFYAFFAEIENAKPSASAFAPVAPSASASAPPSQLATADRPIGPVTPSNPLSFEDVLDEPEMPVVVQQPVVEAVIEEPVDDSVEDVAVGSSEDVLASMDDLYEAFKRLEHQLDTISDSLQTYNQHP